MQDREALRALFAASAPFDIFVNAATGGTRAMGPFLQMDLDGYRGSFAKLWGYANSVRLAAEHMDERGTMVLVSGTPARRAKPGGCRRHGVCTCAHGSRTASWTRGAAHPSAAAASWARYARPVSMTSSEPNAHI